MKSYIKKRNGLYAGTQLQSNKKLDRSFLSCALLFHLVLSIFLSELIKRPLILLRRMFSGFHKHQESF